MAAEVAGQLDRHAGVVGQPLRELGAGRGTEPEQADVEAGELAVEHTQGASAAAQALPERERLAAIEVARDQRTRARVSGQAEPIEQPGHAAQGVGLRLGDEHVVASQASVGHGQLGAPSAEALAQRLDGARRDPADQHRRRGADQLDRLGHGAADQARDLGDELGDMVELVDDQRDFEIVVARDEGRVAAHDPNVDPGLGQEPGGLLGQLARDRVEQDRRGPQQQLGHLLLAATERAGQHRDQPRVGSTDRVDDDSKIARDIRRLATSGPRGRRRGQDIIRHANQVAPGRERGQYIWGSSR